MSTIPSYFLLALAAITISACNRGWSEKEKNAFIDRCMAAEVVNGRPEKKDREICTCLLEKMVSKYPDPKDTVKITYGERIEWSALCLGAE